MPVDFAELKILGLVTLAMLLGALIGFERGSAGKPAGLRTHILVASASAFLVGITDVIVIHSSRRVTGRE